MNPLQINLPQTQIRHLKNGLNVVVFVTVTLVASYFIASDRGSLGYFSQQDNQVRLTDLTDAQVDMIITVKNAMHEAKIQHH